MNPMQMAQINVMNKQTGDAANLFDLLDAQRRKIAQDLHDGLGQDLVLVKLTLAKIIRTTAFAPAMAEELADTSQIIDHALKAVRNTSYLLYPPLLDELGLAQALCWYAEGMTKRTGIKVDLKVVPTTLARMGKDIETALFRIVQECLTNVYRHSGSSRAKVRIIQTSQQVLVSVQDEGRGIPPQLLDGAGPKLGVGLVSMRERVRQLGGAFSIKPQTVGTIVEIKVPLRQNVNSRVVAKQRVHPKPFG